MQGEYSQIPMTKFQCLVAPYEQNNGVVVPLKMIN